MSSIHFFFVNLYLQNSQFSGFENELLRCVNN